MKKYFLAAIACLIPALAAAHIIINSSYIGGSSGYAADAVVFDGGTDYFEKTMPHTGTVANAKYLTISFWFYPIGDNSSDIFALTPSGDADSEIYYNGTVEILFKNTSGATTLQYTSAGSVTVNAWNHFMMSVDLTNSSNRWVYLNNASDAGTWTTYANANMDLSPADGAIYFGQTADTSQRLSARMAEVYIAFGQYLADSAANRRKLITDAGQPVNLGDTCNLPTGTQATFCFRGDATHFPTNVGDGGSFSQSGDLSDAEDSPEL